MKTNKILLSGIFCFGLVIGCVLEYIQTAAYEEKVVIDKLMRETTYKKHCTIIYQNEVVNFQLTYKRACIEDYPGLQQYVIQFPKYQ